MAKVRDMRKAPLEAAQEDLTSLRDRLDEPSGSRMVATGRSGEGAVSEVLETPGAGEEGRTPDLLITNPAQG